MTKEVKDWNKLTNVITEQWIRSYFEVEEDEDLDYWWVGKDIGGVFEFADMFISFQNILDCYKHKISKEKFHEWYWWCLENQSVHISLAKFFLSPAEKEEVKRKHLDELKQRMTLAEKEFKEALEQYGK